MRRGPSLGQHTPHHHYDGSCLPSPHLAHCLVDRVLHSDVIKDPLGHILLWDTYWESEPITIGLVLGLATLTYLFHPAPSNLILVWSAGLGRIYLYRYTPVALVKASLSRAVHSVCVCFSEDLITDPHTHAKAKATYGGPQSPVNSYRSQANSHCGGLD